MKRILAILSIVVWGSLQLFAQQGLLTGKVLDESGEPMPGVNVTIQGQTNLEIGTTVNVGQIGGGIGANTISPSAFLLIDFRYAVDEEGEHIVSMLDEQTKAAYVEGTRSRMSGCIQRPVMVETDATRRFAKLVSQASDGTLHTEKRGGVGD